VGDDGSLNSPRGKWREEGKGGVRRLSERGGRGTRGNWHRRERESSENRQEGEKKMGQEKRLRSGEGQGGSRGGVERAGEDGSV